METVFIDGACKNNGKPCARASYGIFWGDNDSRNGANLIPENEKQTNNTSELTAAIKCLEQVKELNIQTIAIKSDSEYLIRGITSDILFWKDNNWTLKSTGNAVKNSHLWKLINDLSTGIDVSWIHVMRDSEYGQKQSDLLAKSVLKASSTNTNELRTVNTQSAVIPDLHDSDSETELKTPGRSPGRRIVCNTVKRRKPNSTTPSYSMLSALRRIENIVVQNHCDIEKLSDQLSSHVAHHKESISNLNDRITAISNSTKLYGNSTQTSVEELHTELNSVVTHLDERLHTITSRIQSNTDILKITSTNVTKVMPKFNEIVSRNNVNYSTNEPDHSPTAPLITPEMHSATTNSVNSAKRNVHEERQRGKPCDNGTPISRSRSDVRNRTARPVTNSDSKRVSTSPPDRNQKRRNGGLNTYRPDNRGGMPRLDTTPYIGHTRTRMNVQEDHSDGKRTLVLGDSLVKHISTKRMSTAQNHVSVKTLRGARVKDAEYYIVRSADSLPEFDSVVLQLGTNNVSDGDSPRQIIQDFEDIIDTVSQSLPNANIVLSSLLPRPRDRGTNETIDEVNCHLQQLEGGNISVLDNTLHFYQGQVPDVSLFEDRTHINKYGTIILCENIMNHLDDAYYRDHNTDFRKERLARWRY